MLRIGVPENEVLESALEEANASADSTRIRTQIRAFALMV